MTTKQSIYYVQIKTYRILIITADNYTFDIVKEFIHLGSAVTTTNVSLEIKRWITVANRCYYGLKQIGK